MKHIKIFPDISYSALKEMARNVEVVEESDDERNCVNEENKEEDDEFSTYFSDNRVNIPEVDKVNNRSRLYLVINDVSFE